MTHHPQSAHSIGRNALWSMLNNSISQFLVLAVFLVTARFVSKEAFGTIAICFMVIEFFRQVMIESVGITLTARKDPTKEDYNAGFILILAGSALCAVLAFFLAKPLAEFLNNPDLEHALYMTCVVLLTMGLSRIHETWLAKTMQFKILTIRSTAAISIGGGIGIYMAMKGHGLLSLIVQQIVTSVLSTVFLWIATDWRPGFKTEKENIKSLFNYSRHMASNAAVGYFSTQSDIFFSSYYLGAAATGVYNTAKRILIATQMIVSSALNSVALPVLSSYGGEGDNAALRNAWFKGIRYTAALVTPFYVGLGVLSHDVIDLVLGQKWIDVAPVLSVLAIASFISTFEQYSLNIILVRHKPHWLTMISVMNAIINLTVLVIVSRFGLLYLAAALVLKFSVMFPVSLVIGLRLVDGKLRDYLGGLVPLVMASALMGGVLYALKTYVFDMAPVLNLLVMVPIGVIVYFCALYLLDRKLWSEALAMIAGIRKAV